MTIKSFDNPDDFWKEIEKNNERAREYMRKNKHPFSFDDYFVMDPGHGFLVFGMVCPRKMFKTMDTEEKKLTFEGFDKTGFILTYAFSVACIRGEYGDQHVSRMVKISEAEFNRCKALDFDIKEVNVPEEEIERAVMLGFGRWIKNK